MIDIHTHILPELDDGPSNLAESIEMAYAAEQEGIKTIIATPHHRNGTFYNDGHNIREQVQRVNDLITSEGIAVEVLYGQETRINGDILESLKTGEVITLNNSCYMLVELSPFEVPHYTENLFYKLQLEGYKPIIVHPERNQTFHGKPDKLYSLVERGALVQLTAAGVTGEQGRKIKQFCEQLIEAGLVHFVSSDAHNTSSRRFRLRESYAKITKVFGEEVTQQFQENANSIVSNRPIAAPQTRHPKRKKIFGIF
ncbi:tyrosine protein phosphatase [Salibacterium salarium]|uniref:Tyrosine-protein phosphatase n=1 Tax=Salibacterium salarium TaxID=284579 RepID=A0A3R9QIJ1_9BACI|nr:CpsB/CapC family capsule biosynthesis tyrosine phosphatase [Salibacterium salarium]RSL31467.1 tyrosine protein phosphatase [Salibacterium salarium]